MKKTIVTILVLFSIFTSTAYSQTPESPVPSVGDGSPPPPPPPPPPPTPVQVFNSVALARGFLFVKTDHYVGNFWGETGAGKIHANFVMSKRMLITSLRINEENVLLPEPLRGIPAGKLGPIRGFNLRLEARSENQEIRAFGQFERDQLLATDHISIQLRPQGVKQFYPFDGNLDNIEVVPQNYGDFFGWGQNPKGGFDFEVDPDAENVSVQLKNRITGEILANLRIPSAFENAELVAEVPVSVTLEGGVVEFSEDKSYFYGLSFDGSVPLGHTSYPAKVFIGDVGEAGLAINIRSLHLSFVKVLKWTEFGEMPEIMMNWSTWTEEPSSDGEMVGHTGFSRHASLGKVIVVVFKTDMDTIPWISFDKMNFSPTDGTPLPPWPRRPFIIEEK